MILTLFILIVIFGIILLYLGYTQYSFPMVYLAFFVFLVIGLFLFSEGIDFETGTHIIPQPDGSNIASAVYTTYTTENSFVVNIIANVFFYIPFVGVLLSVFFALRGWQ
jgi:hypothetical protein